MSHLWLSVQWSFLLYTLTSYESLQPLLTTDQSHGMLFYGVNVVMQKATEIFQGTWGRNVLLHPIPLQDAGEGYRSPRQEPKRELLPSLHHAIYGPEHPSQSKAKQAAEGAFYLWKHLWGYYYYLFVLSVSPAELRLLLQMR